MWDLVFIISIKKGQVLALFYLLEHLNVVLDTCYCQQYNESPHRRWFYVKNCHIFISI